MAKKGLDAGLVALISAGGATPAVAATAAAADTPAGDTPAGGTPVVVDPKKKEGGEGDAAVAEGEEGAAVVTPAATPATPAAATTAQVTELTTYLKGENTRLNDEAGRAKVALETANATITALRTEQEPVLKLIRTGCEGMAIALNAALVGLDKMDAKALVEQHGKLSAELIKRFPVGGKASTTAEPVAATPSPTPKSGVHSAAVSAARIGK